MIELNELQCLRTLIAHEGSFKSVTHAFLNDPKCQTGGLWPFFELRSSGLT